MLWLAFAVQLGHPTQAMVLVLATPLRIWLPEKALETAVGV